MDDLDDQPPPLRERAREWLQARPAEFIGLCVLLAGASLVTVIVLWSPSPRDGGHDRATSPASAGDVAAHLDPATGQLDPAHASDEGADGQPVQSTNGSPANHGDQVVVHVAGHVLDPGVVVLRDGARVGDAIVAAGGAAADANLDALNLARVLHDGEQVRVPQLGEELPAAPGASPAPPAAGRVDLNRADAAQLETLPGIGPSRARAIIAYRDDHGPFTTPGDLRAVSGIGESTFQGLADLVTVG